MMENPWNVNSISELQFYNCPSCTFKIQAKQTFICHAFDKHPESVDYLKSIADGSLNNIVWPWNEVTEQDIESKNTKEFENKPVNYCSKCDNQFESIQEFINHLKNCDIPPRSKVKKKNVGNALSIKREPIVEVIETNENYDDSHGDSHGDQVVQDQSQRIVPEKVSPKLTVQKKPDTSLICIHCSKQCSSSSMMDNHILYYHSELTCQYCNKILKGKKAMGNHIKLKHETSDQIACGECGKRYFNETTLKMHIRYTHSKSFKKYPCETCGKVFKFSNALVAHMNTVHSEKKEMCEQCGKKFAHKAHLFLHVKNLHEMANQEKDKMCDHCGKTFKTRSQLVLHVRSAHDTSRDFVCTQCGKAFKIQSSLNHHMKFHEEKSFECEICGKKFHTFAMQSRHMKHIHTEKNYACEECGKRFVDEEELHEHVKAGIHIYHHQCQFCKQTFKRKPFLEKHLERKHKHKLHLMDKL